MPSPPLAPPPSSNTPLILIAIATVVALGAFVILGRSLRSPFDRGSAAPAASVPASASRTRIRIHVVDTHGDPIEDASVHIANAAAQPPLAALIATDVHGIAEFADLPAPQSGFSVLVTKDGYSSDGTHAPSAEAPRPFAPLLATAAGETTEATFTIDRLGALAFTFLHDHDQRPFRALTSFTIAGSTAIAAAPNPHPPPEELLILKAPPQSFTTDHGTMTVRALPWDTYRFTPTVAGYDLATVDPPLPIPLIPGGTQPVVVTFAPHAADALLVLVRDAHGAPVRGAAIAVAPVTEREWHGITPRSGQVFVTPMPPGAAMVRVVCPNGARDARTVEVRGWTEMELRCGANPA